MPSVFETQMARQLTQMRDFFGTANSTYTSPGNAIVTGLTVRVQRDESRQVNRPTLVEGKMQTAEVIVLQADLPNPVSGGTFTFAGLGGQEIWRIQTTPLAQNGEFICRCAYASQTRLMPRRAKE